MVGINGTNFGSLKDDLLKSIAESLRVDEELVDIVMETETAKQKRDNHMHSIIKVIIDTTDETAADDVFRSMNDASVLAEELKISMKNYNLPEGIRVDKISAPLIEESEYPYYDKFYLSIYIPSIRYCSIYKCLKVYIYRNKYQT